MGGGVRSEEIHYYRVHAVNWGNLVAIKWGMHATILIEDWGIWKDCATHKQPRVNKSCNMKLCAIG